jgi:plasmid maintenance system antidote protein VapI
MTRRSAVVPDVPMTGGLEPARSRVSWGGVLAGVATTLVVMLLINLLVLWLGLAAIDPIADPRPFEGIGTAMSIVSVLGTAVALFLGGLVAGRLANKVGGIDVVLHGVLTWAVATFLALWLAATVIGTLLTGALGVVGTGLGALGQGAAAVAPDVADRLEATFAEQQAELAEMQEELEPLWTDRQVRAEFRSAVRRIVRDAGPVTEAQRQELIDVVATHTELSEAEAAERVDRWIDAYDRTRAEIVELERDLRVIADDVAAALARAAGWALLGLLVGAVVTVAGARSGAPKTAAASMTP